MRRFVPQTSFIHLANQLTKLSTPDVQAKVAPTGEWTRYSGVS